MPEFMVNDDTSSKSTSNLEPTVLQQESNTELSSPERQQQTLSIPDTPGEDSSTELDLTPFEVPATQDDNVSSEEETPRSPTEEVQGSPITHQMVWSKARSRGIKLTDRSQFKRNRPSPSSQESQSDLSPAKKLSRNISLNTNSSKRSTRSEHGISRPSIKKIQSENEIRSPKSTKTENKDKKATKPQAQLATPKSARSVRDKSKDQLVNMPNKRIIDQAGPSSPNIRASRRLTTSNSGTPQRQPKATEKEPSKDKSRNTSQTRAKPSKSPSKPETPNVTVRSTRRNPSIPKTPARPGIDSSNVTIRSARKTAQSPKVNGTPRKNTENKDSLSPRSSNRSLSSKRNAISSPEVIPQSPLNLIGTRSIASRSLRSGSKKKSKS